MKNPMRIQGRRQEIQTVAEDLYIYGYPLVLSEMARRKWTAVPRPSFNGAPLNQFAHRRFPAAPTEKDGYYPNADCLRSSAWLDLRQEPLVLSIPRIQRFYFVSFWSGWYEVFETIDPRRLGSNNAEFLIVSASSAQTESTLERIVAPTDSVFVEACFEIGAAEDIGQIHLVQDQLVVTPLSRWGSAVIPGVVPYRTGEWLSLSP